MDALSAGHMALHLASQAIPGLSPWIIPVVAVAAKRTRDRTRRTLPGARPLKRANEAPAAAGRAASPPVGTHARLEVHQEAKP